MWTFTAQLRSITPVQSMAHGTISRLKRMVTEVTIPYIESSEYLREQHRRRCEHLQSVEIHEDTNLSLQGPRAGMNIASALVAVLYGEGYDDADAEIHLTSTPRGQLLVGITLLSEKNVVCEIVLICYNTLEIDDADTLAMVFDELIARRAKGIRTLVRALFANVAERDIDYLREVVARDLRQVIALAGFPLEINGSLSVQLTLDELKRGLDSSLRVVHVKLKYCDNREPGKFVDVVLTVNLDTFS